MRNVDDYFILILAQTRVVAVRAGVVAPMMTHDIAAPAVIHHHCVLNMAGGMERYKEF